MGPKQHAALNRGEGMNAEMEVLTDGGVLSFFKEFLSPERAAEVLEVLARETPWKQERGRAGNPFPRLTAYHADEGVIYRYSGVTHESRPWTPLLADLKKQIEAISEHSFNSLLLNFYRDGQDSIGWHSDDEPELGTNPVVASVSLGGERQFVLRHKTTRQKKSFVLASGSLLVMGGSCQHHWQHSVPKTDEPVPPRINLTFRSIEVSTPRFQQSDAEPDEFQPPPS
jgi:alkylated DNA repair dioxygenase AlkB